MTLKELSEIVKNDSKRKFRVKTKDGKTLIVRLWKASGGVAKIGKGKVSYGFYLNPCDVENWVSCTEVTRQSIDMVRRVTKRAKDALKMLNESGLWEDIKKDIEYFLAHPEVIEEFCKDVAEDSYTKFYLECGEGGKYDWCKCHQVFESFTNERCWKSIAHPRWYKVEEEKRIAKAITDGERYYNRWTNGYDCSVEVNKGEDGKKRAWYSEEYRGCGNGHYYLMFDATHAIFYEND